jgi:RsiW-degrading membrane proteinase PrsW (M82 family)
VFTTLRWLAAALVPAALFLVVIYRTDRRREPPWLVALTFAFGIVGALGSFFLQYKVTSLTQLDIRAQVVGDRSALLFVFAVVAPLREVAKVAATWPAFRSKHFDEPYDGIVYASAAALGFAAVENALVLKSNPSGLVWYARAALALPANVFFACMWGYALGRAKQAKQPGPIFPAAFLAAVVGHGLYAHLVYGRGSGALLGVLPMLAGMGVVTWLFARDLRARGDRLSHAPLSLGDNRLTRVSITYLTGPPSLSSVRDALRRADQPIKLRWILFGALVTIGTMVAGLALGVAFGHWWHIDFSVVDEHDVTTTGPVLVLGACLLLAFPVSGYLVAKASSVPTLLEPALAAALALVVTLVAVGLASPIGMVFALACSPVAWGLACAGAWVGRPAA